MANRQWPASTRASARVPARALGGASTAARSWRRRSAPPPSPTKTISAATEPYKTLFALASVTGARLSECLGLVWADLLIDDLDAAEVRFEFQVDRQGERQPLKTEESRRAVEIPRQRSC